MSEYYALATNQNGETQVIVNLTSQTRIEKENEAKLYCKRNGLTFQKLQVVPGTQRQNSTLTKTIESKRGRKLIW